MLESPITGEIISSVLNSGKKDFPGKKEYEDLRVKEIREKLSTDENFWDLVWKPFIVRDFDPCMRTFLICMHTFFDFHRQFSFFSGKPHFDQIWLSKLGIAVKS